MRFHLRFVLCVFVASCAATAWTSEEDEVRKQFSAYIKAIKDKDGKAAVGCVDKKTEEWYQSAVNDAVKADKATILRMNPSLRITALRLRLEFKKEELQKMTGRQTIDMAVSRGWTGHINEEQMKLVKIVVDGETAQGFIAASPQVPLAHFRKESGKWMLELHKFMAFGDIYFAKVAKEDGITVDELILNALSVLSGKKVDESVYEPLK